ncbi:Protein I'm not dead yet [Papilio xuthus]|uniref:Protein I'm not dead yet n=1 Tax=Papilio xuthus TaxID=66420 RepID=A0A194QCN5_PAPXU|nr:Protein I'm not dead yet [Papilio xuthus]
MKGLLVKPTSAAAKRSYVTPQGQAAAKAAVDASWKKLGGITFWEYAKQINRNPMWYCLAGGLSSSYCFMMPVGTPGNLVVQSSASIATSKMMVAGAGPTVCTVILTWFFLYFWAPIIWPDLTTVPFWVN